MDEAVRLLHQTGFDAVAFNWKAGVDLAAGINAARALGMLVQYLHAPQGFYHPLWVEEEPEILRLLLQGLEDCRRWDISMYVMHVCSDFVDITPNLTVGAKNFKRITDTAARYGIAVAFENTEKPAYLETIMNLYRDDANIGFCWDSGHEQCYTPAEDILRRHGHRLLVTHLNDNMGMSTDMANSMDDVHLIPGDGIANWDHQLARLRQAAPLDILTFELKRVSKPGRQKVHLYDHMDVETFFTAAYDSAKILADQYFRDR